MCDGSVYSCPRALSLFFPNEQEIHISGYQVHQGGRRCVCCKNVIWMRLTQFVEHSVLKRKDLSLAAMSHYNNIGSFSDFSAVFFFTMSSVCLWNVRLSLPQTVGGVFIERLADYLLVKSVFGFSLAWDGDSAVYLKMSEEHHGAPCGLCGNFNHISGDDLTTSRGKTGLTGHLRSYPFSQYSLSWIMIIIHSTLSDQLFWQGDLERANWEVGENWGFRFERLEGASPSSDDQ